MRYASLLFALTVCASLPARADEPTDRPVRAQLVPHEDTNILTASPMPKPIYTKWYFWTAVGVTVTASVLASVALLTSPRPARNETDICGPGGCNACIGITCPTR